MAGKASGLYLRGGVYYYAFRVHNRRFHGSTRVSDLPTARKVLEERRRDALLGRQVSQRGMPLLRDLAQEWIASHHRDFSPRHLKNAESALRTWVLPDLGALPLAHLTSKRVLALRSRQLEANLSKTYINNTFKYFKAVLNFGVSLGYLDALPFRVPKLKVQRVARPVIPLGRVLEFFQAVDAGTRNPHVGTLVRVMVGLGLREGEALHLRWEHFNPDQRTYTVWKSKNGETRVIPVPDWLWIHLNRSPGVLSGWVCPAGDGNPHRTQFLSKALRRASTQLGLGNITSHRLRSTYATLLATLNTPLTDIQADLGHGDISQTAEYVQPALDGRRQAQERLARVLGLA